MKVFWLYIITKCISFQPTKKQNDIECHLNRSVLLAPQAQLEPTTRALKNIVAFLRFRSPRSLFFPKKNSLHLLPAALGFLPVNSRAAVSRFNTLVRSQTKSKDKRHAICVPFILEEPNDLDARVLVIFQLRWSDIFDKSKVILKPSVSVILL